MSNVVANVARDRQFGISSYLFVDSATLIKLAQLGPGYLDMLLLANREIRITGEVYYEAVVAQGGNPNATEIPTILAWISRHEGNGPSSEFVYRDSIPGTGTTGIPMPLAQAG